MKKSLKIVIINLYLVFSTNNYVNIAYYHPRFFERSFFDNDAENVKYEKKDLQNARIRP